MTWIGPITFDILLDSVLNSNIPRPPSRDGVYVVSLKSWSNHPTVSCDPLYVGSNTSDSDLFRTRIGSLVADTFGLYENGDGHHSGGQSLHKYCVANDINPKSLYIGWFELCPCHRCAEWEIWNKLKPSLNQKQPARCRRHNPMQTGCLP
jgi:hypothetical protein